MLLTSVNVGIQAVSHVEDAGRAAAMYAFMRTLGMSIGVAVGGTVFQNVMKSKLDELGLPRSIAHDSEAFVKTMELMDPKDPVRIGAVEACKWSSYSSRRMETDNVGRSRRIPRRLLDHHRRSGRFFLHQPDYQTAHHGQAPRN